MRRTQLSVDVLYQDTTLELGVKASDSIDTIYQMAWAAWRLRHPACPPAPEWAVLSRPHPARCGDGRECERTLADYNIGEEATLNYMSRCDMFVDPATDTLTGHCPSA